MPPTIYYLGESEALQNVYQNQRGTAITSFSEKYLALGSDEETFLIEFLYELTMLYRRTGATEPNGEVGHILRQINELNHSTLNRLRDLHQGEQGFTKESMIEAVESLAPRIPGLVERAALRAFGGMPS